MPKLKFPVVYENGIVGVKCVEDIENREAFILVPYKLIMSVHKFQNDEILKPIIDAYPEVFNDRKDFEMMVLTLGMLYQISLGSKSFWYPYLRLLLDKEFSMPWKNYELKML